MKARCYIVTALSHKAKVLNLNGPTSTLDLFSHNELLKLFIMLKEKSVVIFFSSHITSDLEKFVVDNIYIHYDQPTRFAVSKR